MKADSGQSGRYVININAWSRPTAEVAKTRQRRAFVGISPYTFLMKTRNKKLSELLIGLAFGGIIGGIVLLHLKQGELGQLESARIEDAFVFEGSFQLYKGGGRSTAISFKDNAGTEVVHCYIGYCGYPEIRDDFGKKARIWIVDGKVAQIQVDGVIKLTKDAVVGTLNNRTVPYTSIGLGFLFGLLGLFFSRTKREEA